MARVPGTIVALVGPRWPWWLLDLPVETIGTRFGGIPQLAALLRLPSSAGPRRKQLLIPTITIALLGAIESLLCARVADNMTTTATTPTRS
jgi:SulP family sulfate permease